MKIDKIYPLEGIPRDHWKWCETTLPARRSVGPIRKKKKIKPEEMIVEHASGEFVLYDEEGNLEAYFELEDRTLDLA